MIPKQYKMTYADYQAAVRLDAIYREAMELRGYFIERATDTKQASVSEFVNATDRENIIMVSIGDMFQRAANVVSNLAQRMPAESYETEVRKWSKHAGYEGGGKAKNQITNETLHAIYRLGCCCKQLEYGIRANRSWLLRNFIEMGDIYERANLDPVHKAEDSISEDMNEANIWLAKLGLGSLCLDIIGYSKEIVQKARDKKEGEKARAEDYINQVWNDQSVHERKKLTTAYLDGMLAADKIKEEGGEE